MPIETYSPGDTVLTVNGNIISGYADGTFITAEREVDAYTKVVGADGEVSRTKSANRSGRVTLTLKQTSASNAVLMAIAADDELLDAGVIDVYLKDNLGYTIFGGEGWIVKQPNFELGSDEANREWMIDMAYLSFTFPTTLV